MKDIIEMCESEFIWIFNLENEKKNIIEKILNSWLNEKWKNEWECEKWRKMWALKNLSVNSLYPLPVKWTRKHRHLLFPPSFLSCFCSSFFYTFHILFFDSGQLFHLNELFSLVSISIPTDVLSSDFLKNFLRNQLNYLLCWLLLLHKKIKLNLLFMWVNVQYLICERW